MVGGNDQQGIVPLVADFELFDKSANLMILVCHTFRVQIALPGEERYSVYAGLLIGISPRSETAVRGFQLLFPRVQNLPPLGAAE